MSALDPCPCCSGTALGACCGPYHDGVATPGPEATMRARYSAYALGRTDFLFRSWHPRTRPSEVRGDASLTWTGLDVLRAERDVVEFRARFVGPDGPGEIHETSRFEERAGRWVYVEAIEPGRA